jgi:PPP family 3-phenylpropionic acid transporter
MLVFTLAAFIAFIMLVFVQGTDDIFLAAVLGIVLWSSTSPLLESATLKAAERSGVSYGAVRVWLSIAFVASNVVCGLLVSQFGFSIVAPWLAVSCGFQLWGIWALPAPEGGMAAGSFGPHFRATFAEARELLGKPVFLLFLAVCSLIQG